MRLREPKFVEDTSKLTDDELIKEVSRKYAVKHADGWECNKHYRVSKENATLFSSYSEALTYAEKGSKIYQTY